MQEECRQLCEDVGASFVRVESAEILPSIAQVAEEKRITQIVLGQTMRSRLKALLRRPLSERLQHQLRGLSIDLHLISEGLPLQNPESSEP
jgi:two-component system sensor histidine kinase KdpD